MRPMLSRHCGHLKHQASTELHVQPDPPPSGTGSPLLTSKPQRALNMAAVSTSSALAASCMASSAAAFSPCGIAGVSLVLTSSSAPSATVAPALRGRAQKASSLAVVDATSPGPQSRRAVGSAPGRRAFVTTALGRRTACARGLLRILEGVGGVVATPRGSPVDLCAGRRREGLEECSSAQVLSVKLGKADDPDDACVVICAGKLEGGVTARSPGGEVAMAVSRVRCEKGCVLGVRIGDCGQCGRAAGCKGSIVGATSKTATSTLMFLGRAQSRGEGSARTER
ncbi:hypothetical protein I4F81_005081 [Pyropia yezoensis]|uniref:Uncharacterized protein n=1 Tax=Pyropia yezoensis TaxID=2788 RepID=A0ACC3BY23_PYRYE|nr:hypothetical protein I4F81_005081 [Neopyropia yezoensis]